MPFRYYQDPRYVVVAVVLIPLFYLSSYFFDKYSFRHNCEERSKRYREFINEDIRGVIIRAYRDTANHNFPKIIIQHDDGRLEERDILDMKEAGTIICNMHPGDSIIKNKGSNVIKKSTIYYSN
jgi:hypothetical protein